MKPKTLLICLISIFLLFPLNLQAKTYPIAWTPGAINQTIESNLNEITSPLTRKLSLKHRNLTPTEIKIANLIRHGATTKKIAKLMNSSPKTIDTHRKNIRRKFGLDKKGENLRSYLLSIH
jgi:DNA-binding CsgD family transcriptional regulator